MNISENIYKNTSEIEIFLRHFVYIVLKFFLHVFFPPFGKLVFAFFFLESDFENWCYLPPGIFVILVSLAQVYFAGFRCWQISSSFLFYRSCF